MIFVGFFPWETICFSNTIFLIKWFGTWSTWAHTEYIFRKVEHMTEYGKKSLQAIMATRKFSAYSKENIISVKGTSKDAVSGSLFLTLKMDTCSCLKQRQYNTQQDLPSGFKYWNNRTIKKQCQCARVQDEHWEVEKGTSIWKTSGWEPVLLQWMWWSSGTINQNFAIIQAPRKNKKKEENTKLIFFWK